MKDHPSLSSGRPKLLIVDDEPNVLELLLTAFTSLRRYEVALAGSSAAALGRLSNARDPFDVLLLDIQMPTMDGVELLREVRKLPDYAETPVIMLTAMSDRKHVDAAFREGASDYITKPFDFDDLFGRVEAVRARRPGAIDLGAGPLDAVPQAPEPLACAVPEKVGAIEEIDRFIGWFEFTNYVSQLSHGRLFSSHVMAVKLRNFGAMRHRLQAGQPLTPIFAMARSLSEATNRKDCMFCHKGSGVFLLVAHGDDWIEDALDEKRLNRILATLLDDPAITKQNRVLVGEPIPMRSLTQEKAMSALQDAVRNVERREGGNGRRPDAPNAMPKAGLTPKPSLYEQVLWEMFEKDSYLRDGRGRS